MKLEMTISPAQTDSRQVQALLIPQPPNTQSQSFLGVEWANKTPSTVAVEVVSQQKAWVLEGAFDTAQRMSFEFGPAQVSTAAIWQDIFQPFDNPFTAADTALRHCVDRMTADCANQEMCEKTLINVVWNHFEYGSRNPELRYPEYFDKIVVGNCIDINTYLLSALYCARIQSSYLAGFYFKPNEPRALAEGMHCWISTRINTKTRNWDIAHCLIHGLPLPYEGLNPTGGCRAAFSYGRGLKFKTPWGQSQPISHFAKPHWLMTDMSVLEADIVVQLTEGQDHSPMSNRLRQLKHSTGMDHLQFGK